MSPSATIGLDAGLTYLGGFETGNTRADLVTGVAEPITPYEIDNVWAGSVTGSVKVSF